MMLLLLIGVGGLLWYMSQSQGYGITPVVEPRMREVSKYHIVQPGDWLTKIAPRYGLTYEQLLELNPQFKPGGGRDPNRIVVGERIRVRP